MARLSEIERSFPTFRSITKSFKDIFEDDFLKLAKYLGFRSITIEEIDYITAFIFRNYLTFTKQDVFDAFELGASGKTGMSGDDMNHYNTFNIIYVARFLNAYSQWKTGKIILERQKMR